MPQILTNPLTYAPCGYKPAQLRGAYGVDDAARRRATTAGARPSRSSTPSPRRRSSPTRRPTPAGNDPRHPLRSSQFAAVPARDVLVTSTSATPPAGTARRPSTSRPCTPWRPGATSLYVGAQQLPGRRPQRRREHGRGQPARPGHQQLLRRARRAGVTGRRRGRATRRFLQAAAQGIGVLFSSGDNGDEIANTGTRQVDFPASDPVGHRGRRHGAGRDEGQRLRLRAGLGHRQVRAHQRRLVPQPAGLPLRRRRRHQPAVHPAALPEGRRARPRSRTTSARARTAPSRTSPWSATRTPGSSSARARPSPTARSSYSEYRIGGTSLSCPLFAGVVAVADQVHGGPLGFVNPPLYSLAGTPAFRDVDHGRKVTDRRGPRRLRQRGRRQGRADHVPAHARPDGHASTPARATTTSPASAPPTARASSPRSRARGCATDTHRVSAPGQRTAACVTTRMAPHGLSRSGRGTPTTATRSPLCSVRAGAPVRTKRRFAVCRTTHWGRSPSIT